MHSTHPSPKIIATKPRDPSSQRTPAGAGGNLFTGLAREIQEAGLLRRRYTHYWVRLIAAPLLLAGAITGFILLGDTWWQLFVAAGFAVLFTQIAFLGHDAAHRQIFRSGRWNDWASLIIADLFVGLSYGWWQHKHTKHHANPNKEGSDPDLDLPIIAVTPAQAARERPPIARWLIAHQGAFFFPLLLLEGIALHVSSIQRVAQRAPVKRRWVEIAFLGIRIGGFVTVVFLVLSPGIAFAFLGVQLGLFGVYMGASFAPNHKGMPVVPPTARVDFLRRQVLMSRNIGGGRAVDTLMGGLNYQIEHHLFPSMPRPNLRRAAPIIAKYCAEHGVTYTQTSLLASYAIVIRYINQAGLGARDPFDCPVVADRRSF
jgi:fatty acid desaturase